MVTRLECEVFDRCFQDDAVGITGRELQDEMYHLLHAYRRCVATRFELSNIIKKYNLSGEVDPKFLRINNGSVFDANAFSKDKIQIATVSK